MDKNKIFRVMTITSHKGFITLNDKLLPGGLCAAHTAVQ
jgi:hypothetical protein